MTCRKKYIEKPTFRYLNLKLNKDLSSLIVWVLLPPHPFSCLASAVGNCSALALCEDKLANMVLLMLW